IWRSFSMLCATCGSVNSDTAPRCGNCGTPLAGPHAADSSAQPWFAPVAHSPFSNEPLPQPSDALPRLQPGGDILTFTPAAPVTPPALPHYDLADYPTNAHVPVAPDNQPLAQNRAPGPRPEAPFISQRFAAGTPYASYPTQQQGQQALQPGPRSANSRLQAGQEQTTRQAPSASQQPWMPTHTGMPQRAWERGGNDAAVHQSLSTAQVPDHVYPDSFNHANMPQRSSRSASGSLAGSGMHPFIRPMSLWALLGSSVVGAVLLAALVFLNPDWATGALIAGIVSLIMAVLLLITAGVRVSLGLLAESNPHRRTQAISTILLVLLLFLVGGIGISRLNGLHAMQARYLEGQHNWSTAIKEYQFAGEVAPNSANLARVYNEWGEDLSKQHSYADAVARFSTVLQYYNRVPDQQARADTDLLATYLAWGDFAAQKQDYAGATSHYDTLLHLNYCDPGCQSATKPKDASAYMHLAEQQLSAQHFASAVNAFAILTTNFAGSPEAGQIHADYARALWGLGQQQLSTTCADAVKTYQQLAQQFSGTTQGQQAATALQQPVTVKGRFTTALPGPGAPYNPTVALVQGLSAGIPQFQFPPLLHKAPTAHIQSDGSFTIASVPQGTYELVWSNDGTLHFYYASNGNTVLYTAQVGPLCTYDYGAINETIPPLP
ncbi:MAG: hypothetical protein ACRDHW_04205, partial [Ktedonobacteraceae bacterium]